MTRDGVGRKRGSEIASGSGDGGTAGDGPHGDEKGVLGQIRGKARKHVLRPGIYTPQPPSSIFRIANTPTGLIILL